MAFPQMGPPPIGPGGPPSGPDDEFAEGEGGGSSIDPAIIQALVMALLGQSGGGQENIIQMLQQIDPRALQALVFGGALDKGSAGTGPMPPGMPPGMPGGGGGGY